MPLYEFECPECGERQEHWMEIEDRNQPVYHLHKTDSFICKRIPGGHKMLYFEEGRGRTHVALSDKPITSYKQQQRLMKAIGAVEGGDTLPPSIVKAGPKSPAMQKRFERDQKGRWV